MPAESAAACDPGAGLDVVDLRMDYGSAARALDGVTLSVPRSGVVALLGRNGAGKSSLVRAITGLAPLHGGRVTGGSVRFAGESLLGLSPDAVVRRGVVACLEGRRVFADLTVEENLRAGAIVRGGIRPSGLSETFDRFPLLAARRRHAAGYLSGGEQQLLILARALLALPRLLILDEPCLGLAPRTRVEIATVIRQTGDSGTGVLLIEQNATLALELADHAYVMDRGRIALAGPAADLRHRDDVRALYLGAGAGATAVVPDGARHQPNPMDP